MSTLETRNRARQLAKIASAAEAAEAATTTRNETIRKAHDGGLSIRAIAASARLSSARVHQILHGR